MTPSHSVVGSSFHASDSTNEEWASEFARRAVTSMERATYHWMWWCHHLLPPRALPGLWFSTACWGGGGVWTHLLWSRFLVAVEKNERSRSKAREKHFEIISVIFWLRSKLRSPGVKIPKIFQNGFSTIQSLMLKVEQRFWYHRVCIVKARRTIYKMILKGQGQHLNSGQVRPRSRDDRNGSYSISVDSPGRDERTDNNPTSLPLFDQKLLVNDGWWPRVTSWGGNANLYSNCSQLSYAIWFHSNKHAPKKI